MQDASQGWQPKSHFWQGIMKKVMVDMKAREKKCLACGRYYRRKRGPVMK